MSNEVAVKPATPAEIAEFKQACANRYAERGIEPQLASQLFDRYMSKTAGELGFATPQVPKDRVEKVANCVAKSIGRARKATAAKK